MVHGHSEIRNRFQRRTTMILMSLPVLYIVLLKTYADYNLIFPFAEICLHGDEARPVSKEQGYVVILLLFPELSAAILGITMDTRTYLKVRNHVQSSGESIESGARRVNSKEVKIQSMPSMSVIVNDIGSVPGHAGDSPAIDGLFPLPDLASLRNHDHPGQHAVFQQGHLGLDWI